MKGMVGLGDLAFAITSTASLGLVFWSCACLQEAYLAAKVHGFRSVFVRPAHPARAHLRHFLVSAIALVLAVSLTYALGNWFDGIA
jgi:hypothetical protein